jgi:hypothetical protein
MFSLGWSLPPASPPFYRRKTKEIVFRLHSQAVRLDTGRCVSASTFAPKSADMKKSNGKKDAKKRNPLLNDSHDGPATLDGYERKPRSRGLGVGRLWIERRGTETVLLLATLRLSRKKEPTTTFPTFPIPFSREHRRFGVGLEACFHSQLLARSRLVSFPFFIKPGSGVFGVGLFGLLGGVCFTFF